MCLPILAQAHRLVATNRDVRTVLGFAVAPDAVTGLLPDGWQADVAASGPAAGVNLRVTLVDSLLTLDAEGRPLTSPRFAHLSVPARTVGACEGVTLLVAVFSTGGDGGPYGNSVQATACVSRTTETGSEGLTVVRERWQFRTRPGDRLDVQVEYVPGVPVLRCFEDRVRAAAAPSRTRLYRVEQASCALLDAGDEDRLRVFAFHAEGPLLTRLFDGSQRLISVTAVPGYARQVFVRS